jgi:hypothetical protein
VGDDEDGGERGRDRAGCDRERDDDGGSEAENEQQRDQCDRDRDQLAAAQVRGEDPIEVPLDRGLSRHKRRPLARSAQRCSKLVRVILRLGQAQRGLDVRKDGAPVSQLTRSPCGYGSGRFRKPPLEPCLLGCRR